MNRFIIAALPIALFAGVFQASAETTTYNTSISSPDGTTGGCYTGTGCVNSGFTQTTNGTTELDLNAIIRFVGPGTPVGNVYSVPVGTSGGLAIWDWGFSILTRPNGVGTTTLSDYTYNLTLQDVNNGSSLSFNPFVIGDNDGFGASGKTTQTVNQATEWGAQNYENFSFFAPAGFDPNADDTYIVTLTESSGGAVDNSDTIIINAGAGSPTPEPGTFALAGLVLAGLGLARRKVRKA